MLRTRVISVAVVLVAVALGAIVLRCAIAGDIPVPAGLPAWFEKACGPVVPGAGDTVGVDGHPQAVAATTSGPLSFFTNAGRYMPRTSCMVGADGRPDWPWIAGLIIAMIGVIAAYMRIMVFWVRAYRQEKPADRNTKLFELAQIFFWCAFGGYSMSILMFVWPAYRLLAFLLIVLNIWSWRFILFRLDDFRVSMSAVRLRRELQETLRARNSELEHAVTISTAQMEAAKRAAEQANEAKSRFLANTSHEIRTPLTGMLGYLDLIEDDEKDADACRRHHATIRRHAEHLLQLINDLLDLSKIEAGHISIDQRVTNPAVVLRESVYMLGAKARAGGVNLITRGLDDLPPAIRTDPTRLRQVAFNLLSNAVKFAEGGRVELSASVVESPEGTRLRIDVADDGIGMTPEQAERIFSPFEQADESISRRFGGTGLGLVISKTIAETLGGDLTFESEAGKGSVFTLDIPVEVVRPAYEPTPLPPGAVGDGEPTPEHPATPRLAGRVLVVDDGIDNRRLFMQFLRRAGAEVVVAHDGNDAINAVLQAQSAGAAYDLVLMDLQMPRMNGDEAAAALRRAGVATPIVGLSANVVSEARARCMDAGFDEFLVKPIARERLIEACGYWMRVGRTRVAAPAV